MTLKKYKAFDVSIFVVLAVIFELLNYFASTSFDDFKLIFLSYSIVLSIICMYRWGLVGCLVAVAGGFAACYAAKTSDIAQIVAYGIGNVFVIIPALIFQYGIGRERLKKYKILLVAYLLSAFLIVILARCLIISCFHLDTFIDTFSTSIRYEIILESMSFVISLFVLLIGARKNSNLMVEMKGYVKKVQEDKKLGNLRELQESENFNYDKPFTEEDQIDNGNILDGGQMSKKDMIELDMMMKKELEKQEEIKSEGQHGKATNRN